MKKTKTLLQKVKESNTPEALCEALGIDFDIIDISYRGGKLGFSGATIAEIIDIDKYLLPNNIGAYVNYLGGGLRGAICQSDFSKDVPPKKANLLQEITKACVRAYKYYEDEESLNEEEFPDGDTNWEAIGTNKMRNSGVCSAY